MLTATAPADCAALRRTAVAWRPVSSASVVAHRVLFGLLGAFSAVRFLANGWVESLYLAPEHHLTSPWFTWVRPLPAAWMYLVVSAMVPLGLAVAVGYRTRLAAAGYLGVFAYCELIDAALYLNHYWFVTLAMALLVVLPTTGRTTVPAVVVWVLRFQLGVVYVMAGLGKLNADWLLRGEPMRTWLSARTDLPVLGPLLDQPGVAIVASWMGVLFDLSVVGLLLWRRTRLPAWLVLVAFHVVTWWLFPIGVFPWVMIAGSLIFFPPDWPQRPRRRETRPVEQRPSVTVTEPVNGRRRWLAVVAVVWALVQIAVPLRHVAYAGDVRWTEEGYYGSFRVMLTEKTGWLRFRLTDPATGERWVVDPGTVLEPWQVEQAASRADLALAAAHVVRDVAETDGHPGVEVRADSWVSFNGRQSQRLLDPRVDLAALPRTAPAARYVLPMEPPVRD